MNIDGLSEETLTKFVEWGWVNNLSDIYLITTHLDELSKMKGFGKRSSEKLRHAIEKSKDVELDHYITALSIPGIGPAQAKALSKNFKTWDNFSEAGLGNYHFYMIDGIGEVLDQNIHAWFRTMYQEDRIPQLVRNLHFISNEDEHDDSLAGMIFVITGSLNHYSSRDILKHELESKGAKVSGSISSKTSFLVNNDVNSSSSKNKKAKELGIPIISEDQLIQMMNKE